MEEADNLQAENIILIVEDSNDLRAHIRKLLTPQYRIVEAADGEEGLQPHQSV